MRGTAKTLPVSSPLRYRISCSMNLFLAKRLKMARVPAIRIARAFNIMVRPLAQMQRKRLADEITQQRHAGSREIVIDKRNGYAFVPAGTLPELGPAVAEAARVYAEAAARHELELGDHGTSKKVFMQYAANGEETAQCRDIMKLALARPLLDAVTEYLGEVPVIGNVSILVSVPNDSQVGSQLYHLDFADEKQIKMFVYADAVTTDNGPFTFTPAPVTDELVKTYNYDRGRLSIEQVQKAVGAEREIQVTGPAGTTLLCDTSRCLHYGSNRNKTTRVVILIQYVSLAVPEQPPVVWPVEELARDLRLDPIQKLALTL